MRRMNVSRNCLAALLVFAMGCATTSQTVQWREHPTEAAARVAELSATRIATITTVDGGRIWARRIAFARDSVRWTGSRDTFLHQMPLADVARIEIVVKRRGREGARNGAIAGGLVGVLVGATGCIDCSNPNGNYTIFFGVIGAGAGALIGVLFGGMRTDKVIFVPRE